MWNDQRKCAVIKEFGTTLFKINDLNNKIYE